MSTRPEGLSIDDPDFENELKRRADDPLSESIPWEIAKEQLRDDLRSY